MKQILVMTALLTISATANAQIFKCAKPDGGLEFSSIPCNADVGDASLAVKRQSQPNEIDRLESEVAHLRNQASTNIMGQPKPKAEKTKVTVIRDSDRPMTTNEILRSRIERREEMRGDRPADSGVTVIKDSAAPVTINELLRSKHGLNN
jgi:hypothetical protein